MMVKKNRPLNLLFMVLVIRLISNINNPVEFID